jgi:hypothetical protein
MLLHTSLNVLKMLKLNNMNNVTLNKDSWHFKYYSAVVGGDPPKTLCPYFWMMFLLIVISPLILILFVSFKVIDFIGKLKHRKTKEALTYEELEIEWEKQEEKEKKQRVFWNNAGDKFLLFIKYVFVPAIAIFLIYQAFQFGSKLGWLQLLINIGVGILIISSVVGLFVVIEKYGGRVGKVILKGLNFINPFNWKITNIIGEMINAWYTNSCPIVDWVGDETTPENKEIETI